MKVRKIILFLLYLLVCNSLLITASSNNLEKVIQLSNSPPVEYLIITPNEYVDAVKPLAQWKIQRGIPANITTIEGINNSYEGVDIQAKVEEHIRMMVDTEAVKWVVLGGDYLSVPTRMTWTDELDHICNSRVRRGR